MARILVTALPHEGHLNPIFSIAHVLQANGHEVLFLDHPLVSRLIAAQGFSTLTGRGLRPADISILWRKYRVEHSKGAEEMRHAIMLFTSRLAVQANFIQRLIAKHRPDLLLNDAFHYGTALAAELSGIPWVDCWTAGVMHPDASPMLLPVGPAAVRTLSRLFDKRWNLARHAVGLPPDPPDAFIRPSRWLQLYTSCEPIDPALPDLGPTAFCVGPCTSDRQEAGADEIPDKWLNAESPLIYVSLGTFFNRRSRFIRRIVDSAKDQPLRLVASTPLAGTFGFGGLPANIRLCRRVAQQRLLTRSALFVTHGGNNSVHEAMRAGVPMLVVPVAGEQQYNAARVGWLGLGEQADIDSTDACEFRSLIRDMLDKPAYQLAAKDISAKLARYHGPQVAARLIQRLLDMGRPVTRRHGTTMSIRLDTALTAVLHDGY